VLAELDMGRRPLAEFTAEWWERYAGRNLERSTLRTYAVVWNRHLLPRVGHLELRQLTPGAVARLRADLEADGVGPATIRKALGLLQAICRQAVEWEELRANPVKQIRKPPAPRQLAIRPLGPEAVEALRRAMRSDRDATLISVLAYAGLRPEEALALQVRHVGQATLLVEQKNIGGEIAPGQLGREPPVVAGVCGSSACASSRRARARRRASRRGAA
jgi:integrase